ncbi:ABC transporter permease [Streptomyces tauricus]|uniref:ABC transporter permease n=1 Tax=Streptomyces tauricus TaxID=68274 RepID=UPI002242EB1A|nr:ABC transporter permease [Streptomyces tauricus]MCW8103320.1 ABC transporter permease [Streptomyces tauricus]
MNPQNDAAQAPFGGTEPLRPVRLGVHDVLRLGLLGIRTRKMRAVLSALGISIGVATLVLVTAIPASSRQDLSEQLAALGPDTLRVEPQPDQKPPVLLQPDAARAVARIGPVTRTSAVANTHEIVRRSDRMDANDGLGLTVLASRRDLLPAVGGKVMSGKFLDRGTSGLPMVVLGYQAASRLGIPRVEPGRKPTVVPIGKTWFTVIGVLAPMPLTPDLDRSVLVGWQAAEKYLDFDGHPTVLYLKAREDAIEDVAAVLAATVYPQSPGLVKVSRPSDALTAKRAAQSTFSALFFGLACVALLVGGIGVANTMYISVLERRKEIGLRRALGANRRQICGQFLTESVVLSLAGGLVGTATGSLAATGYALYQGWPTLIPATALAAGTAGSVTIGVLAGLYPSVRAARLTPTEALAL